MMYDRAASRGGSSLSLLWPLSQEMGGEIWRPVSTTLHKYQVRPVLITP